MALRIPAIYKKSLITSVSGMLAYLIILYGISALTFTGRPEGPHDVVEGWAAMFYMAVAAVLCFFIVGVATAWWAGRGKVTMGESIKASLLSGLIMATLLAMSMVVLSGGYLLRLLQLMLLVSGIFYLAAVIFCTAGALCYVFVLRGLGSSIASGPSAYAYPLAVGLVAGAVPVAYIALSWNGLNNITVFQFLVGVLVFSAMAACAGMAVEALLAYKRIVASRPGFMAGIAGSVVGALAFAAPLASLLLKGGSIRGPTLVFYSLVLPLPVIAGAILALLGATLTLMLLRPAKTTDAGAISRPLPGLFHIRLALAGGILMALIMFFPIFFDGGYPSMAYYSVSNTVTMASFFIVPAGIAVMGILAVRYSYARSVSEAAAIAGITAAISVFILFAGDMAKNFLHIHIFVPERPLLDMYAYGGLTNAIMCYPFILLILLTIAVCCGVFEYGREQRIKKYTSE